ncbi:AzlC family ABC transporter permease [Halarchaeum nitratireducens]|uniref:Branched-chain amino acid ABC transporter permease n=1 Tax=Halarchaeum nitratireducens TaxID=489913 RepID=A0A830GDK6_9EURY|nr:MULTISPECIES: AzlC family ABC transporter permease [Halarchaeum]MBP2252713.1 4-azaleucine resistance transporter AzlC [Halarchaeum solikamskense]GGN23944.1 branched-chain amino acid ABC transporter permease [Halarchaeum nitratireducens]
MLEYNEPERTEFSKTGLVAGVRQSIPIALGVFTYGIVFGILARQSSLGPLETVLMSISVFGASAQFVVLDLWTSPLPVIAIVVTTVAVNLRLLLMGASIQPWLKRLTPRKTYGILYFLNDESWGLTMRARSNGENDAAFLLGSGLIVFAAWISATALGVSIGGLIQNPAKYGLDMAFIAIYLTLLAGVWNGREDAIPVGIAALAALATSVVIAGNWYIIIGGLTGSIAGVVRDEYV